MNSFIENVNYVAGLDNLYGSGIELYKNNLSLKSVHHDIELKFSYYNNDDKKIHSIVHSEPGVLVGGINDTLLSFKTLVESSITGSEFTCTVSSGVQNFVINNIVMVNISIVSNSDAYKTYELEMKVVTAGAVTYDVFGEVKDSLKILPSLARITASDIDAMANVYEIKEEIVTVSESIADVETVSDSIANVNTVGISISNVNIVCEDIANVNTVATNIVGLNSIVSNMTEILLADDNAAIATTKALESSDSAESSLQSAADAAASAASASNSASAASISETKSATSAGQSATSASSAANSAGDASASANSASTQAGIAATKASDASVSANSASYSANTSSTKASEASASASNALDSENKAEKWASESEDVEVETGEYSAKHWALKSKELSARVALNISYDNTESGLSSSTTQDAIDELDNNLDNLSANVYTKSEINSSLATKAEVVVVDGKVDTHVARNDNPHSVTKTQVGLSNVDNTSDTNKPISISAQNALNQKQNVLVSGTNIKTVNGVSVLGSGNINTVDSTKLPLSGGTMTGAITAIRETKVAMAANNIDLATGNLFTKTISGVTTLTISNALAANNVNSFVLELTNGGSAVVTWFSGVKWSGGTAPTLTTSGKDILGFYSHDGGTTWNILGVNKDVK